MCHHVSMILLNYSVLLMTSDSRFCVTAFRRPCQTSIHPEENCFSFIPDESIYCVYHIIMAFTHSKHFIGVSAHYVHIIICHCIPPGWGTAEPCVIRSIVTPHLLCGLLMVIHGSGVRRESRKRCRKQPALKTG